MGREKQGLRVSPQAEGSLKTPVPFSLAGGFPAYPDRPLQPWVRAGMLLNPPEGPHVRWTGEGLLQGHVLTLDRPGKPVSPKLHF